MTSPERSTHKISNVTFRHAVMAIARKSSLIGAEPLSLRDGLGMLDLPDLDLGTVVGREAKLLGKQDGVEHNVRLRTFNDASRAHAELWGGPTETVVADLRLYATEGDFPQAGQDFDYSVGRGLLQGLIIFDLDRRVFADFGHGTQPSADPQVQRRLVELVGYFGLTEDIIEHQWFDYDDASIDRFFEGLESLQ